MSIKVTDKDMDDDDQMRILGNDELRGLEIERFCVPLTNCFHSSI